nr:hypothetical protein OH826_19895 [Streptomyces sp. NBC_00899]
MICLVSNRTTRAGAFFNTALPPGTRTGLPLGKKVIGHWPMLDEFSDEHTVWRAENWVRFVEVPLLDYPFAVGPGNDRAAVFHLQARLHPDDRTLTGEDWASIVRHLAWTAGITNSDGDGPFRWVAIQSRPQRVDLIANLISDEDGTWAQLPRHLNQALRDAAHDIEDWIDLESTRPGETADVEDAGFNVQIDQRYILPTGTRSDQAKQRAAERVGTLPSGGASVLVDPALHLDSQGQPGPKAPPVRAARASQTACAHQPESLADLIAAVTDERLGDLPRLRRFTETAAAQAGALTVPVAREAQHRLEWIARRLYGMEDDLRGIAQTLTQRPAAPRPATALPPRGHPPVSAPNPHGPVR